ncbi:MAG: response regulator [Candidatus Aenigmatarchaeota archaeon]
MEKILVVDDEIFIRNMLSSMLKDLGYIPITAENGKFALEVIERENPDIVIMDVEMPEMDGITAVRKIKEKRNDIIILMLTAYGDEETMKKCAEAGADDFLIKPIELIRLSSRLELAKRAKFFYNFRNKFMDNLKTSLKMEEEMVEKLIQENNELSFELLEKINLMAEFRDDETHEHTLRVGEIAFRIAKNLNLPDEYCYTLKLSAPLHDIGKIGIPDRILLKPGKLTPEEFEEMKKHTIIGANILKNSKSKILQMGEVIALTHHEKWNGTGYPNRLKEEEIPLEGRIVCISDAIDAMFSKRPYKEPMPEDKVKDELMKSKGIHFDPYLVDKALEIWDVVLAIEKIK